jgi:Mg2+ and Co2+ transporter CorA
MVKLREKTLKLKLEKEELVTCEDLVKVKLHHFQKAIERHEDELYEIQENIAKLRD